MRDGSEDIDGLGVQEVARQLGVHEQTLRRWIWRGKVKATRSQVGRSYRWLVSTEPDAPMTGEKPARERAIAEAFGSEGDRTDEPTEPAVPREESPQRARLSAIEDQIEREIHRLTAQAAMLQAEIDRLNRTLAALRSDGEP